MTPASARERAWRRRGINLTYPEYQKMLQSQGGACAICKKKPTKRALAVDHDHKSGKIRGLLCFFCNRYVIGRRSLETFEKAVAYLRGTVLHPEGSRKQPARRRVGYGGGAKRFRRRTTTPRRV